jgi:type I restriction enzyme S subunit
VSYAKYESYTDSGLQWLGEIPSHWRVVQSRRLFEQRKERAREGDVQLTASQKYGIISQKKFMELEGARVVQVLTGSEILKHVEPNDFVISMRSFQGGLEWCKEPGCVSSAYIGLISIKHIVHDFFAYLLKCSPYIQALQSTSNLVRDGQALRFENFSQVWLPIIPDNEQQKIANFLDHETAKIDTLIEKQQQLIALLKEKRQAVISHAVTKGLNANAPMRDSGVEWLGDVPEHWGVKRLRYLGVCQNGINIGAEYFGSGYPFVSYGDAYKNEILPEYGSGLVQSTEQDRKLYSVVTGDVIFTRTSETVEEIGLSSTCLKTIKDASFAGFLIRFRPEYDVLDAGFSKYYFRNMLMRTFFIKEMNLVTRASLSQDLLKKLPVPLPPLDEQARIAKFLDNKSAIFEKLTENAESAIELMKERRIALISAAVTGKIDVRKWAEKGEER